MRRVDVVIVGAGPSTLGLMCNAIKTNRLHDLVTTGDGIAILDPGLCMGGGDLGLYGINSNTSANGFIKCTYKKREIPKEPESPSKVKKEKNDEDSDQLAEDSEREEQNSPPPKV